MAARTPPAGKRAAGKDNAAGNGGGTRLVIVESPAKARTIAGYLGKGYVVESSIGHIRDMPDKAAEIPEKYRKEPWARLGVNVDNDFGALYVVHADKKSQVSKLKSLLKNADELYLATDEDREGEAIAWHLLEELKPKVPTRRMVFHEITPEAIAHAVDNPRELNTGLVNAYQTRRVLDRLYGYEVSPVLWKKVMPRLSAGRVQSVATRLVVARERERIAFRAARYWDLQAVFARADGAGDEGAASFPAGLVAVDGRRVAQGRDFAPSGELRNPEVLYLEGTSSTSDNGQSVPAGVVAPAVRRRTVRPAPGRRLLGQVGRAQALPALPVRAVPHHHPPAGGVPQARLLGQVHDVGGAAAVRERSHHLYADRLDDAVADRDRRRAASGAGTVRGGVCAGLPARLHQQGQERAGGTRGDPAGRRLVPYSRRSPGCPATSCASTS